MIANIDFIIIYVLNVSTNFFLLKKSKEKSEKSKKSQKL